MRTQRDGNRARAEAAWAWWSSLQRRPATMTPPRRLLPATLALAAVTVTVALPLRWHHLTAAAALVYRMPTTVSGFDDGSWLLVVAAAALLLAARTFRAQPALRTRWLISVMAFATVNLMVIDYIDWNTRGVSQYIRPYYGPGFFVALGGAGLTVVAAVLAWRAPE